MRSNYVYRKAIRKVLFSSLALLFYILSCATIHTVQVANFSFTPASVNAAVGDTMMWQWVSGSHTTSSVSVPAGAATWNSPMNSSNQTFQYVLQVAGTYSYHCMIHPLVMMGAITVSGGVQLTPTTKFEMGYGIGDSTSDAAGTCVQQTFDGGFISTGYISNFNDGNDQFYLVKTDANGVLAWSKSYGGTSANDANYAVQTSDSGYAVTGPSYSFGGQTVLLTKTDANGNMLWSKTYGTGDTLSDASSSSMKQTADGGFIITGYISNYGAGNDDYYLLKTDASGNIAWAKTYGGGGNDDAASVAMTNDGGYIICGTSNSFGDTTEGNIYIVKTDSSGNLQWSKDFGSNDGMDMANSIQQTTDHGYIIGGVTMGATFGEFATLIKTDSTGQMLWTKAYGTNDVNSDASAASVEQTTDGGYVFTGYISNFGAGSDDYYLVKTDANGNLQWTRTYGSSQADDAYFVTQTTDGGYVVAGNTFGFPVSGQHLYVVKTDSLGDSPCSQNSTGTVINTNVVFSTFSTNDTVSTGGMAASVTPASVTGGVATDFCAVATAIKELNNDVDIKVYPNPSSGVFEITSSKFLQNLEVYDVTGRMIYAKEINSDMASIGLSRQAGGVYMIRLLSDNEITTMKIIVGK